LMDGGTTSGYSEIGSPPTAIRPPMKISSEITPAKIGRSMKNFERFIVVLSCGSRRRRDLGRGLRLRVHFHQLRDHGHARAHALHAVDDDALAALQARLHDAHAVCPGAQRD